LSQQKNKQLKQKKIMKKTIWTLTGLALLFFSSCQEEVPAPALVEKLSITSAVNGATYEIKVAQPSNYFTTNEKYAAIYVLDGEENFNLVASQCKKLSDSYGVANVLVVSIGYGRDRSMDYTPTKTSETTGGAPEFMKFIREQLVPRMEQDFRADTTRSHRVILGHSFGGLFGAYAFAADNTLFGNYILLSPSLWFDNEVTLLLESRNRNAMRDRQQLIFMGLGEMENLGKMQAPFEGFYRAIKENYTNVRMTRNLEKDLAHRGSENPNIKKGLEYYFLNR
jgi:uncharacterized protein